MGSDAARLTPATLKAVGRASMPVPMQVEARLIVEVKSVPVPSFLTVRASSSGSASISESNDVEV